MVVINLRDRFTWEMPTHTLGTRVEGDGTLHLVTASNIMGRSSSPPWSSWTESHSWV